MVPPGIPARISSGNDLRICPDMSPGICSQPGRSSIKNTWLMRHSPEGRPRPNLYCPDETLRRASPFDYLERIYRSIQLASTKGPNGTTLLPQHRRTVTISTQKPVRNHSYLESLAERFSPHGKTHFSSRDTELNRKRICFPFRQTQQMYGYGGPGTQ